MGFLILVCAVVGTIAILGGALNALAKVVVALLKYVVGPLTVLFIILYCMKYGI